MPQSLTIGAQTSSGSVKRQRSADSREVTTQPTSAGQKGFNAGQLRPNIRIPPFLDKSRSEIASAFQDLEWKQRFRLFHALEHPQTSPYRVDKSDVIINRNRYGNVQPWDQSRIKLAPPVEGSDYVNASPIELKTRDTSTDQPFANATLNEVQYIATQGPKAGQFSHFWRMVMQESKGDEGVVVMLTQFYEANKEKCAQYLPLTETEPILQLPRNEQDVSAAVYGTENSINEAQPDTATTKDFSDNVKLISRTYDPSTACDVRLLDLTIENTTKRIHHYLFKGWPDFGRPEAENRVALLELTRKTKEIAGGSPRIVHCSAGVGRTGTFVALDFLVREIEEDRMLDTSSYSALVSPNHPFHQDNLDISKQEMGTWGKSGPAKALTPTTEDFDTEEKNNFKDDLIYNTVNALREQRMMMVMNELQYAFLYEAVREVFWNKYRARAEGPVIKGSNTTGGDGDLPRGKVVRVDGAEPAGSGSGSVSEAETEIMEQEMSTCGSDLESDPYAVVAPQHIREGIEKKQ